MASVLLHVCGLFWLADGCHREEPAAAPPGTARPKGRGISLRLGHPWGEPSSGRLIKYRSNQTSRLGAQEKQNVSMGPRLHVDGVKLDVSGAVFALDDGPSRHVQVLRMQPGEGLRLFDGQGREWQAEVAEMGRKVVQVRVLHGVDNDRELPVRVTLAVGMTANDRMDTLVEKATELGAHAIQPLLCARSVLRLDGERAAKKVAHWQAVAVSASEQCGRAVVPQVLPVLSSMSWLQQAEQVQPEGQVEPVARMARVVSRVPHTPSGGEHNAAGSWQACGVLSLREAAPVGRWLDGLLAEQAMRPALVETGTAASQRANWCFFSGPEGGLTPEEEDLALSAGWQAVSLGRRVLRADTAPLAVLSVIGAALGA